MNFIHEKGIKLSNRERRDPPAEDDGQGKLFKTRNPWPE